jgi:HEAT repeat protein
MKLKYLSFLCFVALVGCAPANKITLETKLSAQDFNKLVYQLEGKGCYWDWSAGDAMGRPISPWDIDLTLSERILGFPKYDCQNYAIQIISSKHHEFNTDKVVTILIRHLKYRTDKLYDGRYFPLRYRAIQALTKIKDPRSVDSLVEVILDTRRCLDIQSEPFCASSDVIDQRWAISALGEIGVSRPEIINLLMLGLQNKALQVQQESAIALAKLGNKQAIIPIINLLENDPDKTLQISTMKALGEFGADAQKAVPIIIKRIKQSKELPRNEMITLGEIGTSEALEALDEFTRSSNLKRSNEAKKALSLFKENKK